MSQKQTLTVFGCGSFGTAIAHLFKRQNHDVLLWGRDEELIKDIDQNSKNSRYFPDLALANFPATADLAKAATREGIFLMAIPCQYLREFLTTLKPLIKNPENVSFVNLAKGIEVGTNHTGHEIFSDVFGKDLLSNYAAISGPTFAKELIKEWPAGAVIASQNFDLARTIQSRLSTNYFRLYTVSDLLGTELGGALKNVMAIAVGVVDGLGYGHNARAGLITRCLHEMMTFGVARGAIERTFSGLSGIGDLILTCTGDLSRNRSVGLRLGQGQTIDEILKSTPQVAEGVATAKSVFEMNKDLGVDMPNAEHVYHIIYEGMPAKEAVHRILSRELKTEFKAQN